MSTGPILDQQPETREAPSRRSGGLHLRQIAGMPGVFTVPLVPVSLVKCEHLIQASTGLHVGTAFRDGGVVAFAGVVVPDFSFSKIVLTAEFTSMDDLAADPACSISVIYLDRGGKAHKQYSLPLIACGDLAEFEIARAEVHANHILSLGMGVDPMSHDEAGVRRPILLRGAWLGFPE